MFAEVSGVSWGVPHATADCAGRCRFGTDPDWSVGGAEQCWSPCVGVVGSGSGEGMARAAPGVIYTSQRHQECQDLSARSERVRTYWSVGRICALEKRRFP